MEGFHLKHILIILGLFFPLFLKGQVIRVGPKLGVHASQALHDDENYRQEFRSIPVPGYSSGMVLNVKVSDLFSLHSELLYSRVHKYVRSRLISDYQKEKYNYLQLPVLLRASHRLGSQEVYINAGPSIGYWLGGEGVVRTAEVLEEDLQERPYKIGFPGESSFAVVSDPNRIQLGLEVGGGIIFPLGTKALMIDLRYTWGHTNMAKSNASYLSYSFFNDDLRHSQQVLSLSLAYLLDVDIYTMSTKGKSSGGGEK